MKDYSVKVLTTFEQLDNIKEVWQSLSNAWPSNYEHFKSVCINRSEVISPLVFCIYGEGRIVSLYACRLEHSRFTVKYAYFQVLNAKVKSITGIYLGLMGDRNKKIIELLCDALYSELEKYKADYAFLSHLNQDSIEYRTVTGVIPILLRGLYERDEVHWRLDIPDSFDELMSMRSAKSRSRMRSYGKKLQRDFKNVEMKVIKKCSDIDRLLDDIESVAVKTYQRGLGAGFQNSSEWKFAFKYGFENNLLNVYILYVDGNPVAYGGGFRTRFTFYSCLKGYDPAFSSHRVGTYVMLTMLEDLCDASDIKLLDYGFGDAEYKRQFATKNDIERSIYVFRKSFKGIVLNLIRFLVMAASEVSIKLAEKFGLINKIKKIRRKSFSS